MSSMQPDTNWQETIGNVATSSASDARQLATAFKGIHSMSESLLTWMKRCNNSSKNTSGGGFTREQVNQLFSHVSTFNTYAASHAEVSADMAQRAEERASKVKLVLQEAAVAATVTASTAISSSSGATPAEVTPITLSKKTKAKKRSSSEGTAAKLKSTPAKKAKPAAAMATTKSKPTKLEKDIAKEIKLLKSKMSDGYDKSAHYQIKSSLFRLSKILDKNGEEGVKALALTEDGMDVIFQFPEHVRKYGNLDSWREGDLCESLDPATEIIDMLALGGYLTSDRAQLLLTECFAYWGKKGTMDTFLLEKLCALIAADVSSLSSIVDGDLATFIKLVSEPPKEGPTSYYDSSSGIYHPVKAEKHSLIVKFVLLMAKTPEGLTKLRESIPTEELVNIMDNHEKEVVRKYKWSARPFTEGENCSDSCHADAKRVKELLTGASK